MNEIRTEDYKWLGIIYPEDVRPNVAFITPLAFFNDDDVWYPFPKDILSKYFPNNGKAAVFVRDFPASKISRLCYFWPERNTQLNNPEKPRYSHYLVSNELELELASCAQMLDWTSRAKESLELPNLLQEGIEAVSCFTQSLYIRFQNYLYGPIKLERIADLLRPREYVQSSNSGGPPLLVFVYELSENDILTLDGEKHQLAVFYEDMLDSPLRQEDWSLPQVVIKRVLQASREIVSTTGDVGLIDNHIRKLARLSSQNGPLTLHIEEATLKRGQYIIDHEMERLHDMQLLIEDLLVLPAEHPLLRVAREQEIRLRSTEIAQKAEEQIQGQKKELQQVQNEIREAEAILGNLKNAAIVAEEGREQALEIEREVLQRLLQLREEPMRMLADLLISTSLFPLLAQHKHDEQYSTEARRQLYTPAPIPYHHGTQQLSSLEDIVKWVPNTDMEMVPTDLQALQKKFWVRFAQQNGIRSEQVRVCVALLLAGCIPAISGFASTSLVRAIAQAIANDRMWSVPVPLTALTPLDLFGKIDPEGRMFIPATGSLADIILQAQMHPQELAIVLLEGIDRVPATPVAVPLLRQYIQVRQNRMQPGPLNLFHPRAITSDDPYLELVQFTWPRNILLAVTCDDDNSSLPLPEICEPWLAYIEARHSTASLAPSSSSFPSVPFDTWQRWEEHIRQEALQNRESGRTVEQEMVYKALVTLNINNPDEVIQDLWSLEDSDRNM